MCVHHSYLLLLVQTFLSCVHYSFEFQFNPEIFIIELFIIHGIKNFNENCSLGSNPLRLPLAPARGMLAGTPQLCCDPASNRGRDKLAPPLLRVGWEGLGRVMIYEKINRLKPLQTSNY